MMLMLCAARMLDAFATYAADEVRGASYARRHATPRHTVDILPPDARLPPMRRRAACDAVTRAMR